MGERFDMSRPIYAQIVERLKAKILAGVYPPGGHLDSVRDMAAAAVRCGIKKIRVTGGEPLVRRGAVDFCRMLSEIPGVEELCVTTNGSLLKAFAQPLRDAGVTHLNISLDTLNEERFRAITRLGTLQDTLDGIEAAERAANQ